MIDALRRTTLVAATVTTGLMAGVFGTYAIAVMPGLGATEDRVFVDAFQSIDSAIVHPGFMLVFVGALILSAAATLLHLRHDGRSVLPWAAVATVLYLGAFIITVGVHVPLNDQIKAAGDPDLIRDLASVRERFQEDRWVTWNVVRTVLATCASVLLASALTHREKRRHGAVEVPV